MRVLVTGAAGRVGQGAVADLVAHGHEVVAADRRPAADVLPLVNAAAYRQARFREVDLGDVGQVAGAMVGCDAVVHLGAIPAPGRHPDPIVFANNTGATFAVLHAAELLGVRRVAIASSGSAYGMAWAPKRLLPRYAPIDEGHPLLNHDCYGLSKEVDERTAEMFHRRTGMDVAALRFHWVTTPDESRAAARALADDPEQVEASANGLWGYVDLRDAATACRLAVEADGIGFAPMNVTAADTLLAVPTEAAIREHAPEVELRAPIAGHASGFSLDRARALIRYEPRHSWRD